MKTLRKRSKAKTEKDPVRVFGSIHRSTACLVRRRHSKIRSIIHQLRISARSRCPGELNDFPTMSPRLSNLTKGWLISTSIHPPAFLRHRGRTLVVRLHLVPAPVVLLQSGLPLRNLSDTNRRLGQVGADDDTE